MACELEDQNEAKKDMPLDVQDAEHGVSTCTNMGNTDADTAGVSVISELASPFDSPKLTVDDGMSDTTLEDGEILEGSIRNDVVDTKRDAVVDSKEAVKTVKDESKMDLDSATATVLEKYEDEHTNDADSVNPDHLADRSNVSKDKPATPHPVEAGLAPDVASEDPVMPKEEMKKEKSRDAGADQGDSAAIVHEASVVEEVVSPVGARSLPPHMRPDFQSPTERQSGLQVSKYSSGPSDVPRYPDLPRAPRQPYGQHNNFNYRPENDRGDPARSSAQLMKVRNELDAERKKSANMRKMIGAEKQREMDAALVSMTTDLLSKQAETLSSKLRLEAKERELAYREARIQQLEVYLSEGQKQIYHQDDGELGDRTMADVNRQHERRQAELKMQKVTADMEAKFATHLQHLQLREAAQKMREQQYKALIRGEIEAELKGRTGPEIEEKINEVADMEYNRGFGAGKEAGRKQAEEDARERGFLEGYGACHRAEVTLSKSRQGLISRDSPELDFIYDAAHPHNPFTMGEKMGALMGKGSVEKCQAMNVNVGKGKQPVIEQRKDVVVQRRIEEPARKFPPPRPTFASELRGPQAMHNGHVVLANRSATSSPTATATPKTNGMNGGGMPGGTGESVYEGRRIVKYKETEESNLIDLY
ncbi:hypothetical protein FB567DRAFT_346102 [Paraphoma chrysanthemicola]|uniref:Uncharacterized protein n=1 Tax=Paraphoma chrysanthemicola TaxID=798071 RepID=A0A8K0R7N4_9PLEO|nr:hypothetical protein FB567DRAFT_346102 [Paraphoma chrysanthemicola]